VRATAAPKKAKATINPNELTNLKPCNSTPKTDLKKKYKFGYMLYGLPLNVHLKCKVTKKQHYHLIAAYYFGKYCGEKSWIFKTYSDM
jgi:hypothetical protein